MKNWSAGPGFHDTKPDGIGSLNPKNNKLRPAGSNSFPYIENDSEDIEELDDDEIDLTNLIRKKVDFPYKTDSYASADRETFGRDIPVMASGIAEGSFRSGISPIPGLYRSSKATPIGSGGADQTYRTTGPGKRTGSIWDFSKGSKKSKNDKKHKLSYKFRLIDIFEDEDLDDINSKMIEENCILSAINCI